MRHLVLGLCVLTVSTTGASAQNYLPVREYSGPTTIVNMDVLQGGSSGMGGYLTPPPVLSMPLPPPMPMHAPMAAPQFADPAPMPLVPQAMASHKPVIHATDLGELPPTDWVEPPMAMPAPPQPEPRMASIKTVSTKASGQLLTPAVTSEKDVFITPTIERTQQAITASPPAKSIVQEKPYGRSDMSAYASAPIVPDPVMPRDAGVTHHAGIASAPSFDKTPASAQSDDFEAYRLFFDFSSSELKPAEIAVLDKIINKMKNDSGIRLRMQAYAAGTPDTSGQARRMSLARAMKIRSYMVDKGIVATRLDVRALGMGSAELNDTASGSKAPADRVDVIFMRG